MKCFIQICVLITVVQWCCEVQCKPHRLRKHVYKNFHFGFVPLPEKHFSLAFEKITPFGTHVFKHTIKKRQIPAAVIPPETNSALAVDDHPLKVPLAIEKPEEVAEFKKLPAEVIISTVIEPLEPGKGISFLLPADSEVLITPATKPVEETVPVVNEISVHPELEPKPIEVAASSTVIVEEPPKAPPPEILPPPPEIPPPHEVLPVEPPVATLPIEKPVPEVPVPIFQNINTPVINPVLNGLPVTPFLYTNIRGIPFYSPANIVPFLSPAAAPVPEAVIPQPPPPPVTEIPPPIPKEEPPNFFVKSSRFVLYFGSMMLQMLSQFVNGRPNLNQIPLPPPTFPGVQ